jgi:hypothetical protein
MAITVNKKPQLYSGVKNPLYFDVSTDNFVTEPGTAAIHSLSINTANFNNDDYLEFTFSNGEYVKYVFHSSTTGCDYINPNAWSFPEDVMADLLSNRIIAEYFTIHDMGSDTYELRAKEVGNLYDPQITSLNSSFINVSTPTAGVDKATRPNMRILADIYNTDTDELITTLEALVHDPDSITFDIVEHIEHLIGVTLPDFEQQDSKAAPNHILRINVKFYEYFDNKYCSKTDAGNFVIFNGGLPYNVWTTDIVYTDFFEDDAARRFFTTKIDYTPIRYNQQGALYLYVDGTPTQLNVSLLVQYRDGETENINYELSSVSNSVAIIPVGLSQIDQMFSQDKSEVAVYNITVSFGDTTSETKSFTCDICPEEKPWFMMFQNCYGGMDTLLLSGVLENEKAYEHLISDKNIPKAYFNADDRRHGSLEKRHLASQNSYTANTGLRDRNFIDTLDDLFTAEKVVWFKDDKYVDILITNQKAPKTDQSMDSFNLEFNFMDAYKNGDIRSTMDFANNEAKTIVTPLLVDKYPDDISGAWGLFKLRDEYSGPCIEVLRSSDSTTQTIGFSSSGWIDTIALAAFVGVGDGEITRIYDQSGNGNHLEPPAALNRPKIMISGTIQMEAGKPVIDFDRTYDQKVEAAFTFTPPFHLFMGFKNGNQGYLSTLIDGYGASGSDDVSLRWIASDKYDVGNSNTFITRTYPMTNGESILYNALMKGANSTARKNGSLYATGTTGVNPAGGLTVGGYPTLSNRGASMRWTVLVAYDADKSTDEAGIETVLNSYLSFF